MKRSIKNVLMGIVCLGISIGFNVAQDVEKYVSHPDTMRIDLPDGQNIEFSFVNIKNAMLGEEFINYWNSSINNIQSIVGVNNYKQPVRVKIVNKELENHKKDVVEIEELPQNKSVFIMSSGELVDLSKFNVIYLEYDGIKIKARLNALSLLNELKEIDFEQIQTKLTAKKEEIYFDNRKAYYISADLNENTLGDLKVNDSGVTDYLNLSAGLGVAFFRDKLAPEISLNMSFNFTNKHGVLNRRFGLQSSFFYMFDRELDGSYNMDINTFLTGYYMVNSSKSTLKDRWTGLGVGYLIDGNGGYFGDNTFKLSLMFMSDSKGIDIMPELVITDDFKTVFPSLRLGFSF